jgi:hypothetical protein
MGIRTTVTLDDDVVERVKAESRSRGASFNETLNELVRLGLAARTASPRAKRFKPKAYHTGVIPGLNYDKTGELLEYLEGRHLVSCRT